MLSRTTTVAYNSEYDQIIQDSETEPATESVPALDLSQSFYSDGSFEFVKDTQMRLFLNSAHRAITVCELWDWLSGFNPSDGGFMFTHTPELTIINKQMEKDEINGYHSGSSYASIMRNMQFIAKHGIVEYEKYYMSY
jgi:hypothetical protein